MTVWEEREGTKGLFLTLCSGGFPLLLLEFGGVLLSFMLVSGPLKTQSRRELCPSSGTSVVSPTG